MRLHNSRYFNIYRFCLKPLALVICCFLFVSCNKNETQQFLTVQDKGFVAESALNINTASAEELEKLPHIGAKLAQKIIEYRQEYGPFRKAEHLLLVPGISDERFRQIRSLIKVE